MIPYIKYLILAAIALIAFDAATTLYGISLGFEEENAITLQFISLFGDFGIVVASIAKTGIAIFPYVMYRQLVKYTELTESKMKVCRVFYTAAVIIAGLSALNSGINNLILLGSTI